jgi:hypothetical protein
MPSAWIRAVREIRASFDAMLALLLLLGTSVGNLFKSRRRLEVENLFLRHQLNIALGVQRTVGGSVGVTGCYWYG